MQAHQPYLNDASGVEITHLNTKREQSMAKSMLTSFPCSSGLVPRPFFKTENRHAKKGLGK